MHNRIINNTRGLAAANKGRLSLSKCFSSNCNIWWGSQTNKASVFLFLSFFLFLARCAEKRDVHRFRFAAVGWKSGLSISTESGWHCAETGQHMGGCWRKCNTGAFGLSRLRVPRNIACQYCPRWPLCAHIHTSKKYQHVSMFFLPSLDLLCANIHAGAHTHTHTLLLLYSLHDPLYHIRACINYISFDDGTFHVTSEIAARKVCIE